MVMVELFVVLLFIYLGARIGGIGIGFAGGAGVIALSLILGVPTSQAYIPVDVILIIMSVITAIAAMQVAGGLDWMVQVAEDFCVNTLSASPLRANRDIPNDTNGGYRSHSILYSTGYCRSGERPRRSSFSSTVYRGCGIANRYHSFSNFSGSCGVCSYVASVWCGLPNATCDLHSNHVHRLYDRCIRCELHGL